jgi:hypothetical protein
VRRGVWRSRRLRRRREISAAARADLGHGGGAAGATRGRSTLFSWRRREAAEVPAWLALDVAWRAGSGSIWARSGSRGRDRGGLSAWSWRDSDCSACPSTELKVGEGPGCSFSVVQQVEDGGGESEHVVGDHNLASTKTRSCSGGGARLHGQCPNTRWHCDGDTSGESPARLCRAGDDGACGCRFFLLGGVAE